MPTRIIEQRAKEQPCCGGSIIKNELVFGRASSDTPPCVDTEFQILDDSTRQWLNPPVDWVQNPNSGLTSVNTGALVVVNDNSSTPVYDSYWTAVAAYGLPFDETKHYFLTINYVANPPENFSPLSVGILTIQTSSRYYDLNVASGLATGLQTFDLGVASTWSAGNSPQWAVLGNPPQPDKILFTLAAYGLPFDGFVVGTMALTYTECI